MSGSIIQTVPSVETGTVLVRESGQYAFITPRVPSLMDVFFTAFHAAVDKQEKGLRVIRKAISLVWNEFDCEIPIHNCFRGLTPLVIAELKRRGYDVKHEQKALAILPEPRLTASPDAGNDVALLKYLRTHDRGIIRYGGDVQIDRLVLEIATAWPNKRIVIVATRKADARGIYKRLVESMEVGLLLPGRAWPSETRVIVATPAALGMGPAEIEHRDLYLALNPDELFPSGEKHIPIEGIKRLWRARLFGFLPSGKKLAPRRRDYVNALFGFDELVLPAHGHTQRPIRVVSHTISGWLQPNIDDGLFASLQKCVHSNAVRNRLIRKLTYAFMSCDPAKFSQNYPGLSPHAKLPRRRVVVYVDNVNHGLTLARCMKLPLVTDIVSGKSNLSTEDIRWLDQGVTHAATLQPVIVTTQGLKHLGPFDVLIRADAGADIVPLPNKYLRNGPCEDSELLIVDIRDGSVPKLRFRARQRLTAYREAGWNIVGEPSPSSLERFKASRQEVFHE